MLDVSLSFQLGWREQIPFASVGGQPGSRAEGIPRVSRKEELSPKFSHHDSGSKKKPKTSPQDVGTNMLK